MTTANLNEFVLEGKRMTNEQKMSEIELSNYDKILGFHAVTVKRNGIFKTIQAFYLAMFENVYTCDGILIANRIS